MKGGCDHAVSPSTSCWCPLVVDPVPPRSPASSYVLVISSLVSAPRAAMLRRARTTTEIASARGEAHARARARARARLSFECSNIPISGCTSSYLEIYAEYELTFAYRARLTFQRSDVWTALGCLCNRMFIRVFRYPFDILLETLSDQRPGASTASAGRITKSEKPESRSPMGPRETGCL